MSKDEMIEIARQAGAHDNGYEVRFVEPKYLERFAKLVEERAAAKEREQDKPVALVTGVYGGRFTYAPIKASVVLPVGMALYTHPQPKAKQEPTSGFFSREAMKEHSDFHPQTKAGQDELVFHIRQYGDVTKEQLDCYIATGRIDTHPQPKQEQGEPVAWMSEDEFIVYTSKQVDGYFQHDHIPLYTQPQPRKPLTDEQIDEIADTVSNMPLVGIVNDFRTRFARAIEAAHGIKE